MQRKPRGKYSCELWLLVLKGWREMHPRARACVCAVFVCICVGVYLYMCGWVHWVRENPLSDTGTFESASASVSFPSPLSSPGPHAHGALGKRRQFCPRGGAQTQGFTPKALLPSQGLVWPGFSHEMCSQPGGGQGMKAAGTFEATSLCVKKKKKEFILKLN